MSNLIIICITVMTIICILLYFCGPVCTGVTQIHRPPLTGLELSVSGIISKGIKECNNETIKTKNPVNNTLTLSKNNKTLSLESFQNTAQQNPITIADIASSVMQNLPEGKKGDILQYNGTNWIPYVKEVITYNFKGSAHDLIYPTVYVMNILRATSYKSYNSAYVTFNSNKSPSQISIKSDQSVGQINIPPGVNYLIGVTVNKYVTNYKAIHNLNLYIKGARATGNVIIGESTIAVGNNYNSLTISASGIINNTVPLNNFFITHIFCEITITAGNLIMSQTVPFDTNITITMQEI